MNRIPKAVYAKDLGEGATKLAMTGGVVAWVDARRLWILMKTVASRVHAAKASKRELAELKMERNLIKNISRRGPPPDGRKLLGFATLVRTRRSSRRIIGDSSC